MYVCACVLQVLFYTKTLNFAYSGDIAKVDSTPKAYATDGESIGVVATVTQVALLRGGKVVFKTDAPYDPLCVAVHPNKTEVAVGGKVRWLCTVSA